MSYKITRKTQKQVGPSLFSVQTEASLWMGISILFLIIILVLELSLSTKEFGTDGQVFIYTTAMLLGIYFHKRKNNKFSLSLMRDVNEYYFEISEIDISFGIQEIQHQKLYWQAVREIVVSKHNIIFECLNSSLTLNIKLLTDEEMKNIEKYLPSGKVKK